MFGKCYFLEGSQVGRFLKDLKKCGMKVLGFIDIGLILGYRDWILFSIGLGLLYLMRGEGIGLLCFIVGFCRKIEIFGYFDL